MGSQSKRKKATKDNRSIIADIKREHDQAVIRTAIQPTFEGTAYQVPIISQIDFINVSESIDAAQTNAPTPPAQITGLSVTPISNTQLNLAWTASGSPGVIYYNVYRGIASGSEVGPIAQPTTNSSSDTGLVAGTPYYYKVSAVNNFGMEGTLSAEATGTTTGTQPAILLLHLDGDFSDSSVNNLNTSVGSQTLNGFVSPGIFGASAVRLNYPSDTTPGNVDWIQVPDNPVIQMNSAVGFTISFWVFPQDITAAGPAQRMLIFKNDDANNKWSIVFDATGLIHFSVKKAGTDYKRQISGLVTGSWQHICAVFNGVANTVEIYKNLVAGAASVAAPQYSSTVSDMYAGAQPESITNTHYEGYVDEVQYFQRVLTLTEITNLKNTNAP